jgi:hypothetical protein
MSLRPTKGAVLDARSPATQLIAFPDLTGLSRVHKEAGAVSAKTHGGIHRSEAEAFITAIDSKAYEELSVYHKNWVINAAVRVVPLLGLLPLCAQEKDSTFSEADTVSDSTTLTALQIQTLQGFVSTLAPRSPKLLISVLKAYPPLYLFIVSPAMQDDRNIARHVLLADGNAMEYISPAHVFDPIARLIASSSTMRLFDRAMQDGPVILQVMEDAARLEDLKTTRAPSNSSITSALIALGDSDAALDRRIEPYFVHIESRAIERARENSREDYLYRRPDMNEWDFWWSVYTEMIVSKSRDHPHRDSETSTIIMPASAADYRTTIDSIEALRSDRKLVTEMVGLFGETLSYCIPEFQRDPELRLLAAASHEPTALLVIRDLAYDAAADVDHLRRTIRRIGENVHWSRALIVGRSAAELMKMERPALLEWVGQAVVKIMLLYPSTAPGLSEEQVRVREQLQAEAERIVEVIENPDGRVFQELRKRRYEEDLGPEGEGGFRQTRKKQSSNNRRGFRHEGAERTDAEDAAFEEALFTHVHWVHADELGLTGTSSPKTRPPR